MAAVRAEWGSARRIVIKIGSSLLTDAKTGALNREWLSSLIDDVATLKTGGKQVILVSSGAIALGRKTLELPSGPLKLEENQAAASVGQIGLAHAYEETFRSAKLVAAQILLTLGDTEERRRYLNARSTMETLLRIGAVPVVNENDTVATSEIRYGDNDRLAARVASMMSADCLILLSDVDGLYTSAPDTGETAELVTEIKDITPRIEAMAGDTGTELSRGGMVTKIEAAKIAVGAGTHMVIASGKAMNPMARFWEGGRCTWFVAHSNPGASRKRWIAGALEPRGVVVIDDGAVKALKSGKSLLPAGVSSIEGPFGRGDAVIIHDAAGAELGRGLSAYSHQDAQAIIGHKSREISELLGYRGRDELIHRDDMALKQSATPDK
jgi:glutamate 5-kinase